MRENPKSYTRGGGEVVGNYIYLDTYIAFSIHAKLLSGTP